MEMLSNTVGLTPDLGPDAVIPTSTQTGERATAPRTFAQAC